MNAPFISPSFPVSTEGAVAIAFAAAEAVYDVTPDELRGASTSKSCTLGRALVTCTLRQLQQPMTYALIGEFLGERHSTTVSSLHLRAISLRLSDLVFSEACHAILVALKKEAAHGIAA